MMKSSRIGSFVALFTLVTFEAALFGCSTGPTESESRSEASPITDMEAPFVDRWTTFSPIVDTSASCMCTACDDGLIFDTLEAPSGDDGGVVEAQGADASFTAQALRGTGKKCLEIGGELAKIGEAATKLKESLEFAKTFAEKVKTNGGFDVVRNGQTYQVVWKNLTSYERSIEYFKAYGGLAGKVGGMVGAIGGVIALIRKGGCVRQADLDKVKKEAEAAKAASDEAIKAVQAQLDAEHKGNTEAIKALQTEMTKLKEQNVAAQAAIDACSTCPVK